MRDTRRALAPYVFGMLIVALLLGALWSLAFGQVAGWQDTTIKIEPLPMVLFYTVHGDRITSMMEVRDKTGEMMVSVDLNGTVVLGKNYKPDEVGKAFWEAIVKAAPSVCEGVRR